MLDDLRNSVDLSFEEEGLAEARTLRQRRRRRPFLGMTAPQRFFLSLMLFMMVAVLGMLCLVVTGRMMLF
jgi:hypothetical protein